MEEERYTQLHDETHGGFDIAEADDGKQADALTDDGLVFATSERVLENILARSTDDE